MNSNCWTAYLQTNMCLKIIIVACNLKYTISIFLSFQEMKKKEKQYLA